MDRGVSKEREHLDLWSKEIAPSTELREWYHAHLDLHEEFKTKYFSELKNNPDFEGFLNTIRVHEVVTLLTATKDLQTCEIPVLAEYSFLSQSKRRCAIDQKKQ